jgi:hypothetical protein
MHWTTADVGKVTSGEMEVQEIPSIALISM